MICQDCGMAHAPDDKGACIEGHGDDIQVTIHGKYGRGARGSTMPPDTAVDTVWIGSTAVTGDEDILLWPSGISVAATCAPSREDDLGDEE